MAVILPSTYTDGTAVCTNGSPDVVGTGTMWLNTILPGDFFWSPSGESVRVLTVVDNTHITLAYDWPGATQVAGPYEIRFQSDQGRVQETTRQLLERMQSGNLYAFAGLSGMTDTVPYFTGPGAMGILTKQDLTNGVNYDVQVDTLADRNAYDTQATGFVVFVSDMGDGRSAIFTKESVSPGDWSNAAYITGPRGLTWRGAWSSATSYSKDDAVSYNGASFIALTGSLNTAPTPGATWGSLATRGATGARGMNARGTYSGATAYLEADSVLYNGSTFVALQNTTGNTPPTLPTTSNAYWQLVAVKGTDGTGTGDVVGPNGVVDGAAAMFNTTTGKLIKAATPSEFRSWVGQTAATVTFNNSTANLPGNPTNVQAAIEAVTSAGGKNDSLFALDIADLKGQRLGMNGGVADSFDDQAGIFAPSGGIDSTALSVLHLNGANGSTAITDDSLSPKIWTVAGNAQISTAQSKFGGASLALDGTGDYIAATVSADYAFGTGDFTLDFWARTTAVGAQTLIDFRSASLTTQPDLYVNASMKVVYFTGGADRIIGNTVLAINTWYHIALVRSAGVSRLYINGTLDGTPYTDSASYPTPSSGVIVGSNYVLGTYYTGFIDELRISKSARWTAAFVPPTAAYFLDTSGSLNYIYDAANDWFYPSSPSVGGIDGNTLVMLHLDGVSTSTTITDSNSVTARTWTVFGDAQLSSVQTKFGATSLFCDGVADYIATPATSNLAFGTGDFTVDFWIRPSVIPPTTAPVSLWDSRASGSANNPILLLSLNTVGTVTYYTAQGARIVGSVVLTANVWYHITLVRASGVSRLYINGVQDGISYADATSVQAESCVVGANYAGDIGYRGYIDEFRISNVARWTANFIPPAAPYSALLIDRTSGTNIGDLTGVGGLAAAFDGNLSQASTAAARSATISDSIGYVGKNYGGSPQLIGSGIIYGANDCGFDGTGSASNVTINLRAKNGTAPTGSTDGVLLGSVTLADIIGTNPQTIVSNDTTTPYQYVWFDISSTATAGIYVGEAQFFVPSPTNNMTLVSVNYPATSVPSTVRTGVQLVNSVPLTVNTDFACDVSRDGGTTWSTITLTLSVDFGNIKMYEGVANIAGQPSGSAMKWRFRTLTNKNVIVSGVVEQWS